MVLYICVYIVQIKKKGIKKHSMVFWMVQVKQWSCKPVWMIWMMNEKITAACDEISE